jgi:hypothetical protein
MHCGPTFASFKKIRNLSSTATPVQRDTNARSLVIEKAVIIFGRAGGSGRFLAVVSVNLCAIMTERHIKNKLTCYALIEQVDMNAATLTQFVESCSLRLQAGLRTSSVDGQPWQHALYPP